MGPATGVVAPAVALSHGEEQVKVIPARPHKSTPPVPERRVGEWLGGGEATLLVVKHAS